MNCFSAGGFVPRESSAIERRDGETIHFVPKTLGPFATPERKRTFAPDDVALFRLLCGLHGLTPGKMFRRLVQAEAKRLIGIGRSPQGLSQAKDAAAKLFVKGGQS